jgi:hypothetical protein
MLFLPKGSRLGKYEVQVSTELGRPLLTATGTVASQNSATSLSTKLDVSKLSPGTYVLAINGARVERREYPLVGK